MDSSGSFGMTLQWTQPRGREEKAEGERSWGKGTRGKRERRGAHCMYTVYIPYCWDTAGGNNKKESAREWMI